MPGHALNWCGGSSGGDQSLQVRRASALSACPTFPAGCEKLGLTLAERTMLPIFLATLPTVGFGKGEATATC